jgi:hypothetical protein
VQIGKNNLEDPYTYAAAIYICRVAKPHELVAAIKQKEEQQNRFD